MAYREDLFIHVLTQMGQGRTQKELSEELNKMVQECRRVGKKGEITLKISIKPDTGDTGQYFLTPEIKAKPPKYEQGKTIMWGTPDGNLQRHDPAQSEMDLKVVPQEVQEPKFLDEPQAPVKKL